MDTTGGGDRDDQLVSGDGAVSTAAEGGEPLVVAAPEQQVSVPTLVMWGQQDDFLESRMAAESLDYCDAGQLMTFPSATHWVLHERPEETAEELLAHLHQTMEPPA